MVYEHVSHFGDLRTSDVELKVKYGGDTSFDIFPFGWDKTYVLDKTETFSDYDKIWFIGDRCNPDGNDYEIFMHPRTISSETDSIESTIKKIQEIISG